MVYSLVSTEMFTRPFFPSGPVHKETNFNPPRDIPEQLAAYSTHSLSTALLMLGENWLEVRHLRFNSHTPPAVLIIRQHSVAAHPELTEALFTPFCLLLHHI